ALAGLDRPLGARYLAWLGRSARLDFGASPVDGRPVRERVAEALPATAALALLAALIAVALAVALGLAAALFARRRFAPAIAGVLAADGAYLLLDPRLREGE